MRRAVICILCIVLTIFLISACAGPTRLDKDYGRSVKQARINQTLDPEAEKNLEPVTGFDGKAAQITIEKYRKSFEGSRVSGQPLAQTGTQVVDKPIEGGGFGSGGYGSGGNK